MVPGLEGHQRSFQSVQLARELDGGGMNECSEKNHPSFLRNEKTQPFSDWVWISSIIPLLQKNYLIRKFTKTGHSLLCPNRIDLINISGLIMIQYI
jgi:hypothetical protein